MLEATAKLTVQSVERACGDTSRWSPESGMGSIRPTTPRIDLEPVLSGLMAVGPHATAEQVLEGQRLDGTRYFVTGATAGVGFETASALAGHGGHVYIGARDLGRGNAARGLILERHVGAQVDVISLDLASLASVDRCATELDAESLDVLICNAGVYGGRGRTTADGFEEVVGVSHIGHFALFQGLAARLAATGNARVVVVASESHRSPPRLDLDALPYPRRFHLDYVAYGQAKLCNVLFALELDRRYADIGIRGNALHPGSMVATSIGRGSLVARIALTMSKPFTKSIPQAAATSVWAATAPELAGVGGRYFRNCRELAPSREARREDLARVLWERTEGWIADARG